MDGAIMEALADKVHKQGEHIPQCSDLCECYYASVGGAPRHTVVVVFVCVCVCVCVLFCSALFSVTATN